MTTWTNWAGNQVAEPIAVHRPTSEHDLSEVVKQRRHGVADQSRRVRVQLAPLIPKVCDFLRHAAAIKELCSRFKIGLPHPHPP